jgi:ADP-ribose pyrophosphatase YjhB (NUDIX family)
MARAEPRARHTARLVTLSFLTWGPDVLLLRHPETNDRFPGLWNGIGGHVEAGEDIRAAATRELREEAGVEGAALSLRAVVHESGLVGHDFVLFVFVGRAPTRDVHAPEGTRATLACRRRARRSAARTGRGAAAAEGAAVARAVLRDRELRRRRSSDGAAHRGGAP